MWNIRTQENQLSEIYLENGGQMEAENLRGF